MTNTNETFADIIAEMRGGPIPQHRRDQELLHHYADRLEAAWKREKAAIEADALAAGGLVEASRATAEKSSAVGNMAAMREALEACVAEMCDRCRELAAARGNPLPCLSGCEPVRKAKFALAKPVRNCDKYSHDEALRIWSAEPENPMNGCFDEWLYLPATEGGAK